MLQLDVAPAEVERGAPGKGRKYSDQLRMEAGIVYTTDPDGVTIPEIQQDPRFAHVPLDVLWAWCRKDGWVQRRKEVFEKIRRKVEDTLAGQLAQANKREYEELSEVSEVMLGTIRSGAAQPKTLEGVAKALVEVNERREALRIAVAAEMVPTVGGGGTAALPTGEASLEEVRSIAREALRRRRDELRARLGGSDRRICPECGFDAPGAEALAKHKCEKGDDRGPAPTPVDT